MSGPAATTSSPTQLMVVNCWGADAVFFDYDTLVEIARIQLPPQPHEARFDPKRGLVYVTCPYKDGFYDIHEAKASQIVVIDPIEKRVVDVIDVTPEAGPHGLYVDVVQDLIWVTVESGGGAVLAIDPDSRKIVKRLDASIGEGKPHWMAMTPDGTAIFTANKESRFVPVIDVVSGERIAEIPVAGGAEDVEFSSDGSRVLIASRELPLLHVIDTATYDEVAQVQLDDLPGRVYRTSQDQLVVTFFHFPYQTEGRVEQGRLGLVDLDELTQTRSMAVGCGPMDLTSTTDGSLLYVTNSRSGTLYEIDIERLDVCRATRTGPLGHASHGVLLL